MKTFKLTLPDLIGGTLDEDGNWVLGQPIIFEIEIEEDGGMITSNLPGAGSDEMPNAFNAVEFMVLNHAVSGIDVTSEAYQEGLETTLEFLYDEYQHQ